MKQKRMKNFFKTVIFIAIFLIGLSYLNQILQPDWLDWNNYDTTHGFYEQPDNTIETVFLGASIAVNGFTPMELYEDYGISAWNLATEQQPMLASYYWLVEAYRYHPETLKTAVLDTSMLRTIQEEAYYEKALLGMRFSFNKYQAVRDCTDTLDEFMAYLFPTFAYHTRWKELEKNDFTMLEYETNTSVRGYHFVTDRVIDSYSYNQIGIPGYIPDEAATEQRMMDESLLYLQKMVEFCEEKGIELILTKTPGSVNWTDSAHNAVEEIAEENQLTFLDFNYSPYLDEIGYCEATDSQDMRHMNYYGAEKLTRWFGEYLVENCGATDIREDERYDFMKEELEEYHREIVSVELDEISDLGEYLQRIKELGDYTVFLSVKDDGANMLTEEQRAAFAELGLERLSELQFRDSYLAVIENGKIVYEELEQSREPEQEIIQESEEANNLENIENLIEEKQETEQLTESEMGETDQKKDYLEYEGKLPDGSMYTLISGGVYLGDISSCVIDGEEYSPGERGINVVVYDNLRKKVVDQTVFDTCIESERSTMTQVRKNIETAKNESTEQNLTGTAKQLYLYETRCSDVYRLKALKGSIDENGLCQYLETMMKDENYLVVLSSKGNAAAGLDEETRQKLAELGFDMLSQLEEEEHYLAVIDGGTIVTEKKGSENLTAEGSGYRVTSGRTDMGDDSSIKINQAEYSRNLPGMNLVVYNRVTNYILDWVNFDTTQTQGSIE